VVSSCLGHSHLVYCFVDPEDTWILILSSMCPIYKYGKNVFFWACWCRWKVCPHYVQLSRVLWTKWDDQVFV